MGAYGHEPGGRHNTACISAAPADQAVPGFGSRAGRTRIYASANHSGQGSGRKPASGHSGHLSGIPGQHYYRCNERPEQYLCYDSHRCERHCLCGQHLCWLCRRGISGLLQKHRCDQDHAGNGHCSGFAAGNLPGGGWIGRGEYTGHNPPDHNRQCPT